MFTKNIFCGCVGADYAQCPRTAQKSTPTGYDGLTGASYYVNYQDIVANNYTEAAIKALVNFPAQNVIEGSGGDYLSNEIFYRVSRLRTLLNANLKSGHIHTPEPQIGQVADILAMIEKIKEIIKLSI